MHNGTNNAGHALPTHFATLSVELLNEGTALRFIARGTSMEPFIRDRDVLTVQAVPPFMLRPGDVLFFKSAADRILVHRLVRRVGQGADLAFVTRGDGSLLTDEPVDSSRVLGRVTTIERGDRTIHLDRTWRRVAGLAWMRLWLARRVLAAARRRARALAQ